MSGKVVPARFVEASRERAVQNGPRISPKIQGLMSRFQEAAAPTSAPPSLVRRSATLAAAPPALVSVVGEEGAAEQPVLIDLAASSPPLSPRQEGSSSSSNSPYLDRLNQAIASSPISPRSSRRGTLRGFAVVKKEVYQVQRKDNFLVEISAKIQEKDEGRTNRDPRGMAHYKRAGDFCLVTGKEGFLEWIDVAKTSYSSKDVEKAISLVLRELETCLKGKIFTIEEEGGRIQCSKVLSRLLLNPYVQEVLSDAKNAALRKRVILYFQAAITDEPRADAQALQHFFQGSQEAFERLAAFLSQEQEAAVARFRPSLEAIIAAEAYSESVAAPVLDGLGVVSMLGGPISDEDRMSFLRNVLANPAAISISNGRSLCLHREYFAQVREGVHEYAEALRVMDKGLDQFLELEAGRRLNEARRLEQEEGEKSQPVQNRTAAAENHNALTKGCYDSHDYGQCLAFALKRVNRAMDIARDTLPAALKSFGHLAIHHLFAQEKITRSQAVELREQFSQRTKEPIAWNAVLPLLHTLSVISEFRKIGD